MGSGRTVFRTEVEERASPFRANIHQVVELRLLGRRLDMARLQGRIDQFLGSALPFLLEVWGHGLMRLAKRPRRIINLNSHR